MPIHNKFVRKIYALIALVTGMFAVGLQFWLVMKNVPSTGLGYWQEFVRFISYMTILSNLLVIIFFIFQVFDSYGKVAVFFKSASAGAAIFLYISIVGVVNHIALAGLFQFTGYQYFADKLLHYVMPSVYVIYWIFFIPKSPLPYKHIFYWVLFPLVYVIYIMLRGMIMHVYPYPFLDVPVHGYPAVLVNMAMLTAAYFFAGLTLIFVNNRLLVNRNPITL
jgi:hypothetical protein